MFVSVLVSVNHIITGLTLFGGHAIDLIMIFGINIENMLTLARSKMISDQYLISFSHNRQYAPHHCMKCTIMLATVSSFVEIFQSGFGSQHRTEKALVKDVNDPLLVLC